MQALKFKIFAKKNVLFIFIPVVVLALVVGLFFLSKKKPSTVSSDVSIETKGDKYVEVDGIRYRDTNWKELVQLNYETGEKPLKLAELENHLVRIPGYIVPLTDEVAVLDEFLFVPNDQACIHVPPPPPNLIIRSKLGRKLSFDQVYNPSWLMGKLQIQPTNSEYGAASYQIEDAKLQRYEDTP